MNSEEFENITIYMTKYSNDIVKLNINKTTFFISSLTQLVLTRTYFLQIQIQFNVNILL